MEATVWATFYAGIVAFQYHPANPAKTRLTTSECATIADQMMKEFLQRYPEVPWLGSPESPR